MSAPTQGAVQQCAAHVQYLARRPAAGQTLSPSGLEYGLGVMLMQDLGGGDTLLKLIDAGKSSGEELLCEALKLTTRESQVLFWISNGKTNREIAEILGMSPRTVNKHLEQFFRSSASRIARLPPASRCVR